MLCFIRESCALSWDPGEYRWEGGGQVQILVMNVECFTGDLCYGGAVCV